MPNFRDIVTAVLRDLTRAQDASNRLSAKLAEKYRDGEILHYFPVPNALAKEVELELKFAVEGTRGDVQAESIRPGAAAFRPTARTLAALVLADVRGAIEPGSALAAALSSDAILDQLSAHVAHTLHERRERDGQTLDVHRAARWIEEAILGSLTHTPEVASALEPARLLGLIQASRGAWQVHLERLVSALDALTVEAVDPELEVLLDTRALGGLPSDNIHLVRIRAELRNYRWVVTEASGAAQLLPEG